MAEIDDFLAHYGVKGMRWGVRKGVVPGRMQRTKKENAVRETRKTVRSRRQTISDKTLDSMVKRLEQEKKLKTLLDDDLAPARTATKKVLANVGTKVAGTVLAGASVWAIKTALDGGFRGFKDLSIVETKDKLIGLGKGVAAAIPNLKK